LLAPAVPPIETCLPVGSISINPLLPFSANKKGTAVLVPLAPVLPSTVMVVFPAVPSPLSTKKVTSL